MCVCMCVWRERERGGDYISDIQILYLTVLQVLKGVLYSHNHDQQYKHIIHIHLHMYAEQNDTVRTSNTVF